MPLLNNGRPYVVPKAKAKKAPLNDPETACFVVRFTGEAFSSKAEYDRKMDWYKAPMWMCRITGQQNMPFEECVKMERSSSALIRKNFPSVFERPVLSTVQSEPVALDTLCALAARKLQCQLFEDEPVEVSVDGKLRSGCVVSVSKPSDASELEREYCKPVVRKPNESERTDADGAQKTPLKKEDRILPYRYTVKLDDGDTVSDLKMTDIRRMTKLPAREVIRGLIRSRALRRGSGPSWTVDEDVARRLGLNVTARWNDFVADDSIVAESYGIHRDRLAQKARRENANEGENGTGGDSTVLTLSSGDEDEDEDEDDDVPLETWRNATPASKTTNGPNKRKSMPATNKKHDAGQAKTKQAAKRKSMSDSKRASMKQQDLVAMFRGGGIKLPQISVNLGEKLSTNTPNRLSISKPDRNLNQTGVPSGSHDSVTVLTAPPNVIDISALLDGLDEHVPTKPSPKKKRTKDTKRVRADSKKPKKNAKAAKDAKKSPTSKKDGMKQSTLLKYADRNASSPTKSPKGSPAKSKTGTPNTVVQLRAQPIVVRRLLEVWKRNDLTKAGRAHLLAKCARTLTDKQIDAIPHEEVRSLVAARRQRFAEEEKLKAMTADERKAYLCARRRERRAAGISATQTDEKRLFEDLQVPERFRVNFDESILSLLTFDTLTELRTSFVRAAASQTPDLTGDCTADLSAQPANLFDSLRGLATGCGLQSANQSSSLLNSTAHEGAASRTSTCALGQNLSTIAKSDELGVSTNATPPCPNRSAARRGTDSSDEDDMTLAELKSRPSKLLSASSSPSRLHSPSPLASAANAKAEQLMARMPDCDSHFGVVAMCSEFIHAYWPVLVRVDSDGIKEDLEDAVGLSLSELTSLRLVASVHSLSLSTPGPDDADQGLLFIKVTMLLCRRLLLDDAYAECRELGVRLRDVTMTAQNIGEFLHSLFAWLIARRKSRDALRRRRDAELRKTRTAADEADHADDDAASVDDAELLSEIESITPDDVDDDAEFSERIVVYERLRKELMHQELDQLAYSDKLDVLDCLLHRVMQLDAVNDHLGKLNEGVSATWRRVFEMRRKRKADAEANKATKSKSTSAPGACDSAAKGAPGPNDSNKENADDDADKSKTDPTASATFDSNDIASKVKRRRLEAERSAAERAERDRLRAEESRKQREVERFNEAERDYCMAAEKYARARNVKSLGSDRFHRRYWLFSKAATPGLFVEHGWALANGTFSVSPPEPNCRLSSLGDEAEAERKRNLDESGKLKLKDERSALLFGTVPQRATNCWFAITSVEHFQTLLASLNERGARESELRKRLVTKKDTIEKSIEAFRAALIDLDRQPTRSRKDETAKRKRRGVDAPDEPKVEVKVQPVEDAVVPPADRVIERHRTELANRLISTECRLRNGGLGGVFGFDEWEARVQATMSQGHDAALRQLGACLLETFEQVAEKFRCGVLGPPPTGKLLCSATTQGDDSAALERVKLISKYGELQANWKRRVAQPSSFSQLHFLLSVMSACIKWDKSVADARCRICKRKGDDERALLCDECNRAYHTYCLRPPLLTIPDGDWYCPSCAPAQPHSPRRRRDDESQLHQLDARANSSPTSNAKKSSLGQKRKQPDDADEFGLRRSRRARTRIDYNEADAEWTARSEADKQRERKTDRSLPTAAAGAAAAAANGEAEPEVTASSSCAVCYAGRDVGAMLACVECGDTFHLDCHEPPLRYPPRGRWTCTACRTGTKRKTRALAVNRDTKSRRSRLSKKESERSRSRSNSSQSDSEDDGRCRKRSVRQRETRTRPRANYRDASDADEPSQSEQEHERDASSSRRATRKRVTVAENSSDSDESGEEKEKSKRSRKPKSLESSSGKTRPSDSGSAVMDEDRKTRCLQFIRDLNRHEASWPFRDPVSEEDAPDYRQVICEPMDLKMIGDKLKGNRYRRVDELLADLSLMLRNCYEYNGVNNTYSKCADTMIDLISRRARLHLGRSFSFDKARVPNGGTKTAAAESLNSSINSNESQSTAAASSAS